MLALAFFLVGKPEVIRWLWNAKLLTEFTLLSAFYHTRSDVSFAPTEKTRAKQQSQCKSKKRTHLRIHKERAEASSQGQPSFA